MIAPIDWGVLLLSVSVATGVSAGTGIEMVTTSRVASLPRVLAIPTRPDPIRTAQLLEVVETTFPNLARDLDSAELLRRVMADQSMRGKPIGRNPCSMSSAASASILTR
jgi:hypothetical protein